MVNSLENLKYRNGLPRGFSIFGDCHQRVEKQSILTFSNHHFLAPFRDDTFTVVHDKMKDIF